MSIKQAITHNLLNIPGWHTNRKIVVIESDDWGAIRMPSREVYKEFMRREVRVDRDPYCRYDGLATKEDLANLFEVLNSVRDKNGNPAVLTANAVVANPVFEKIKESGFSQYFYEPFTETLKKSPRHDGAWDLWQQGIREGLFHPQFHGREHLNVSKWLKALKEGDEITRLAFDLGSYGLTDAVDSRIKLNYMGAFNSGLDADTIYYKKLLKEGLDLFDKLFGYRSESFIATTYVWNPKIEPVLREYGVKYLQGMVHQKIPLDDDTTFTYKKDNFTGRRSKAGLIYLSRNAFFEPAHHVGVSQVDQCLERVNLAFRWYKPAIISMHRINTVGSIDASNAQGNLKQLRELLTKIVNKWPDVEFMTTDQLGSLII